MCCLTLENQIQKDVIRIPHFLLYNESQCDKNGFKRKWIFSISLKTHLICHIFVTSHTKNAELQQKHRSPVRLLTLLFFVCFLLNLYSDRPLQDHFGLRGLVLGLVLGLDSDRDYSCGKPDSLDPGSG